MDCRVIISWASTAMIIDNSSKWWAYHSESRVSGVDCLFLQVKFVSVVLEKGDMP
jgi:hypothetical protein